MQCIQLHNHRVLMQPDPTRSRITTTTHRSYASEEEPSFAQPHHLHLVRLRIPESSLLRIGASPDADSKSKPFFFSTGNPTQESACRSTNNAVIQHA
ncbi:hypothetical protein M413DRAFT_322919 [Hebeloma cylindrosporum]|uniref:Uncharacterized protein n=1 Tax=Hebeloma cylindrosporum TaxID=76867 RepID=A0A0C2Y4I7_HEBCY|nr:hypothetical protein M413DRAFT_322919 [Hebeloma cylindrosporum h7]